MPFVQCCLDAFCTFVVSAVDGSIVSLESAFFLVVFIEISLCESVDLCVLFDASKMVFHWLTFLSSSTWCALRSWMQL